MITDNDAKESAKQLVHEFMAISKIGIMYCVEPRKSIALARNQSLRAASGDAVAFIDDDEFPGPAWLLRMYKTMVSSQADGVLGPVKPYFESPPPAWLIKAGLYDRTAHKTGFVMTPKECRTGNVLISKNVIEKLDPVFRPEFAAGGEDRDLFRRLIAKGYRFIWCNEAPVFEIVPPHRWKRRFLLRAALLRGNLALLHTRGDLVPILESMLAIPLYALSLPVLQLLGHQYFMIYLVKLGDHTGRLLALAGFNPVRDRRT